LKVLVHFLRVKRDGTGNKPPSLHALNAPDKNFEIDILLKIVQSSDNKNSGVDTASLGPEVGVVIYTLGACMVCLYKLHRGLI
jgi:hypothetical protein